MGRRGDDAGGLAGHAVADGAARGVRGGRAVGERPPGAAGGLGRLGVRVQHPSAGRAAERVRPQRRQAAPREGGGGGRHAADRVPGRVSASLRSSVRVCRCRRA